MIDYWGPRLAQNKSIFFIYITGLLLDFYGFSNKVGRLVVVSCKDFGFLKGYLMFSIDGMFRKGIFLGIDMVGTNNMFFECSLKVTTSLVM